MCEIEARIEARALASVALFGVRFGGSSLTMPFTACAPSPCSSRVDNWSDSRAFRVLARMGYHTAMQARPQSLAEIARESSVLEDFGRHVRDFLHEWKRAQREGKDLAAMIGEAPPLLATAFPQGDVCDAFLAALGEHFAEHAAIAAPNWVRRAGRHLAEPWYPAEGEVLREHFRRDALRPFRERNLFLPASALAVA
jgi:hypothetical protein